MWSSNLTSHQSVSIERVQRRALQIIMFPERHHYEDLLIDIGIPSLALRRTEILTDFAKSITISTRHRDLFPPERQTLSRTGLRNSHNIHLPLMRTQRYKMSSVPALVRLYNNR